MFTFGREHERQCAIAYVRNPAQVALILGVVDAVHDLVEGKAPVPALGAAVREAFVNGGSGVWEQAGSWLRKSSSDYPQLQELWGELAQHPSAQIRFRVACSLDDMAEDVRSRIAPLLAADRSRKVANMARSHASA